MTEQATKTRCISIRLKINGTLILLFLLMLLVTGLYQTRSQRELVEQLVMDQTENLATSYFDSINTLMLTGGMGNRDIPRNKLLAKPEVLDARIIRGPGIIKFFGEGSDYAKPKDELDRRALQGEAIQQLSRQKDGRVLTLLIPMPASREYRGVNCIMCHVVPEGDILGAIRLDYSLAALDSQTNKNIGFNILINSSLMVLVLIIIGFAMSRFISAPLRKLNAMMKSVAEGRADFNKRLDVNSNDELGTLARHFNTALRRFSDILDQTQRQSDEATRIKTALDCVSTSVMMADREHNIIYMNEAVHRMFRLAEADLRKLLPNFDADHILGRNIDLFHKQPTVQRAILDGLRDTHRSEMTLGERHFRIVANPVVSDQGERLGTAVEWTDLTAEVRAEREAAEHLRQERRQAMENLRIRTALDNVSSSVMVADADMNIIYLNKTAQQLFRDSQQDIRRELTDFDAERLMGANIDRFHRKPQHQRQLLNQLTQRFQSQLELGGRTFRIIANPVVDEEGNRLGTAVEWADRTTEVAVEREIGSIVDAARQGDLSLRVRLGDKSGFFLQLGEGINDLTQVLSDVFENIAHVIDAMAQGDLTTRVEGDYQGTFGKLQEDITGMREKLRDTVQDLRDTADQMTATAAEISTGNNNLSARSEQQAASLEETAASMEQLTSTVKNNAENAQQANLLANQARDMANRGGDIVNSAIASMSEINRSSTRISEIIGVIDEIAFQTNLLALNASVEAARAGEQGRGFAVVATEVRNLAGRSATAAREIKELIQDSVNKIQAGSRLVNQSGETLNEIVQAVMKVSDIIAEIAAASAQQSAGIDQVNQAVTTMDSATQQNAALAEQTSAASASMADKTEDMKELVSFFKVQ